MDGGPHFKNLELANYFKELKQTRFFSEVEWNFFVENHGKNPCDCRFSSISFWMDAWSSKKDKEIRTTEDLIEAVRYGQTEANKIRLERHKPVIFSTQLILTVNPQASVEKLTLPGISSFYHFTVLKNCIQAKVLRTDKNFVSFPLKTKTQDRKTISKKGYESPKKLTQEQTVERFQGLLRKQIKQTSVQTTGALPKPGSLPKKRAREERVTKESPSKRAKKSSPQKSPPLKKTPPSPKNPLLPQRNSHPKKSSSPKISLLKKFPLLYQHLLFSSQQNLLVW
jgi:hypothetical protein